MLYQQGDILIRSVSQLPSQLKALSPVNGRYVFAEGEETGHAHVVLDSIRLYSGGFDTLYCVADDYFTVRHEEHNPIIIPPGLYLVRKVKQYDYFSEENSVVPVID